MTRPSRLGKYLLLEQLHQGAIAELFIARANGIPGAEPLVALKRLLPSVLADDEFVSLFVDEARIAAQLSHGNIVHVLEVGSEDDTYFMAMEYVSGRSLQALLTSPMVGGRPMPIEQAAFIACELCDGLDFAHRKKDLQGRELGIVHRGVSPANVLISYEGGVKLIDFGMAKAASSSHMTQAGNIRGKYGYMSPEQIKGLPLDRRSDIFSVGVVLYEMLTGVNPFAAMSDMEAMRRVAEADVPPPHSLNPYLPDELEAVLLKALAVSPEDRYAWASELQQALAPFTFTESLPFGTQQLGEVMLTFFGAEAENDAALLRRLAAYEEPKAAQRPSRTALPIPRSDTPRDVPAHKDPLLPFDLGDIEESLGNLEESDRTQIVMAPRFDPPPVAPAIPPVSSPPVRKTGSHRIPVSKRDTGTHDAPVRPSRPSLPAVEPLPKAIANVAAPALEDDDESAFTRPAFEVDSELRAAALAVAPPSPAPSPSEAAPAAVDADDQAAPPPRAPSRMPMILGGIVLLVVLAGVGIFFGTRHAPPQASTVRVQVIPPEKATVTIGGHLIEIGKSTQLPPGQYDLVAVAPGFKQHIQQIAVLPNEPEAVFTVLLEPEKPATPVSTATPPAQNPTPPQPTLAKTFTARFVSVDPGVEILVEGKSVGQTPHAEITLPVGSAYPYVARRAGYEEVRGIFGSSGEPTVTVTVALKKVQPKRPVTHHPTVAVSRKEVGQGGLVCTTKPAGARVEIDGKLTSATTPIYPDDPIMLSAGKHRVVFRADGKRSAPQIITVEKGGTVVLKDIAVGGGGSDEKPGGSGEGELDSPEMMGQ